MKIDTRWHSEDTLQCFHGEELVGEAFFNGGQWLFFYRDNAGDDIDHAAGQEYIEIDPHLETVLRRDEERAAQETDPGKRAVLEAEVKGRRRMYRDDEENRDLVRIRAAQLARFRVRDQRRA